MQEWREIVGIKWENNIIVGLKLSVRTIGLANERYMSLQELHDEQILNETNKIKPEERPLLTLQYRNEEDGGSVSKFVYIAKIGRQYEIRDVKDGVPETLLETEKI
jgi:hypothetical protein